ncbi:MAG: ribonuclease III domain-containing protein [Methanomassiliicoccales archaeon]
MSLEERIGYRFTDRGLLERALTTVGRSNEMGELSYDRNQEALATLGDGVLRLLVMEWLIQGGVNRKGEISQETSERVSAASLSLLAEKMALEEFVHWGQGELEREEWHRSSRLLAECLEALLGAVYLDGGLDGARSVLEHTGFMQLPEE